MSIYSIERDTTSQPDVAFSIPSLEPLELHQSMSCARAGAGCERI